MSTTPHPRSLFWEGFRAGLPFIVVIAPFGLLFGVVATEAGLNIVETMAMTVLVIAGSAQFTAIALMEENAPTLIVILTAVAVNLRMALYSASMAPHLGKAAVWQRMFVAYMLVDQSYAVSAAKLEAAPQLTQTQKFSFFTGVIILMVPCWYGATFMGAVAGEAIPPDYALDFAVPITFIAIFAPLMRSLPHLVAAVVSVVFTLALLWVPYALGLIIAAMIAMPAGAATEIWLERRRA